MAVDKNLFLYDLAVVAILKNEGHYLKEWLDYHLLAGVDHFYLYDNESTDNYREIVAPYVETGLVTSKYFPGKRMQLEAYDEAVNNYRFLCRRMAFIDLDEFIFPKDTTGTINEKVDDILKDFPEASGLSVHWQCFGSNGQKKADYSRGVLERFTRRAKKDFFDKIPKTDEDPRGHHIGNIFFKSVLNPRRVKNINNHYVCCFEGNYTVNEKGANTLFSFGMAPVFAEKIAINHYFTKSREEFDLKRARGRGYSGGKWPADYFSFYDRNEVFDDGILKYRAARAKIFSLESDAEKFSRAAEVLTKTLTAYADGKIFDLETALTCRAVSNFLNLKVHEEASLAAILKSLDGLKFFEVQLLLRELPNLLILPYSSVKEIRAASIQIISRTTEYMREKTLWEEFSEWNYLRRLLQAWQ